MPHVIPGPDKEPEDYARFTYDSWRDLDNLYAYWIQRWKRTIEYIRGQHWNQLKTTDPEKLPKWKRYPVINITLAVFQDYLQEWLASEVRWSAMPASPDPQDISAAELVEQLNRYTWDRTEMSAKRIQIGSWLLSCGTAYLRVFWDTNTGKMIPLGIPDPESGKVIAINPDTGLPDPGMEPVMVDQGDIGIEVVSPSYVRYNPSPAHGVMLGLSLAKEEVISMYGADLADELSYTSAYEDFDVNLHSIETPATIPAKDERALVVQHYIPRSSIYPDGLWWTAAKGGKLLLTKPYPLPGGQIPIVPFVWLPVPGNPYIGTSPLYDLTFSNKLYDELAARILEWHNKVKPKILLKAGGGLTLGDINDEPFQELPVNPGAEPEFMETKQAPSTFYQTMQDTQNDMMMVAGYALSGNEPPDKLGGGEATNRWRTPSRQPQTGPTAVAIMNSKAAWEKLGNLIPAYAAAFYTEPRVIAVQGKDRSYQWKEFIGSVDLKDISATISVDEVSLYPWNRQSLRDSVYAVLDSTFGQMMFMDPATGEPNMDRLNAAMNATGLDVSIPSLDPDSVEAKNEHMVFEKMQQPQEAEQAPQPQFWQNHQTHLDEHERVLKSMMFKSWPQMAQQTFMQHVEQTSEMLNEAAQQEQQSQIDMEKALREVREQAELQADLRKMLAETILGSMEEAMTRVFDAKFGEGQGTAGSKE